MASVRSLVARQVDAPFRVRVCLDNIICLADILGSEGDLWQPTLLLVPLRLGIEGINRAYMPGVKVGVRHIALHACIKSSSLHWAHPYLYSYERCSGELGTHASPGASACLSLYRVLSHCTSPWEEWEESLILRSTFSAQKVSLHVCWQRIGHALISPHHPCLSPEQEIESSISTLTPHRPVSGQQDPLIQNHP